MGMSALLCAMSAKRVEILEEEPGVLSDLLAMRHERAIPGLLDLDVTWDALEVILEGAAEPALADAIVAHTGRKLKARGAYGSARILDAGRVADIALALSSVPETLCRDRYPMLYGRAVHGGYGQEIVGTGDSTWLRERVAANQRAEIDVLSSTLQSVRELYQTAAASRDSVMSILV